MHSKFSLNLLAIAFLVSFFYGCENNTPKNEKPADFYKVTANGETDPIPHSGDAADDPAIWINAENPENSIIFGSDKKGGIASYNLSGKQIKYYPVGKINNIDIRYHFPTQNGQAIDILVGSNRTESTFDIFMINPENGELKNISAKKFPTNLNPVYGICLYESPVSGKFYVFISSKKGDIEQWELFATEYQDITIDAKLVRTLKLNSTSEGMVADDINAVLYVAEEDTGIWKFLAEPSEGSEEVLVVNMDNTNLKADIEGLTIFLADQGKGYLLASSQGNHSYAVFDREAPNAYLGSFVISDSDEIQGTYDTDGIAITGISLGEKYPFGLFVAQDGGQSDKANKENQNFKLVNWKDIAKQFKPALLIDPNYNPYLLEEEVTEE